MTGKQGLQRAVLSLHHIPGMRRLTALPYDLCLWALKRLCSGVPEVRALYVPREYSARTWVPGSSDIDLCVVLQRVPWEQEQAALGRLWDGLLRLRRVFPFLSAGFASVAIYDLRDLQQPEFGWRAVSLHERAPPRRWTLVYGRDARHLIRSWTPSPPRLVPVSPDLHELVDKRLHRPLLAGREPPGGYLGSEQRLALKLLEVVLAHLDGRAPSTPQQALARLARGDLDPTGGLLDELRSLDRHGGRPAPGQEPAAALRALGLGMLRVLESYFTRLTPRPSEAGELRGALPMGTPASPPCPEPLLADLKAGLPPGAFAVVYPRSHLLGPGCPADPSPRLGVTLVLRDLQPEAYARAIRLLSRLQRGRWGPAGAHLRLDSRILGRGGWTALLGLCAAQYVFEGVHLLRAGVAVGDDLPGDISCGAAPPSDELLRLALQRRLTVERCHLLRTCNQQELTGARLARCQNPLLSLMSYRVHLGGGPVATLGGEILSQYGALHGHDPAARAALAFCRLPPDSRVTPELLDRYLSCTRDALRACCVACDIPEP